MFSSASWLICSTFLHCCVKYCLESQAPREKSRKCCNPIYFLGLLNLVILSPKLIFAGLWNSGLYMYIKIVHATAYGRQKREEVKTPKTRPKHSNSPVLE